MTRILMISNSTDFNTLLDRAGVSSSGRDLFNWTADFARDPTGKILLPSNSPTGAELQTFLKNNILPEINGALDNLSKVTSSYETTYKWFLESGSGVVNSPNTLTDNTKFWRYNELIGYKLIIEGNEYIVTGNTENTITITPNWSISNGTYNYNIFEEIEIDYGDVLVLKGSLLLAKAGIFILNSYDLNIDIDTIVSFYNSMTLNIQTHIINAFNQLLTLLPTQQLSQAKTVLREAINVFTSAINFIVGETDPQDNDLFIIDNPADEQKYRNLLADLNNALDGTAYVREVKTDVNLVEFFDHPKILRNYLPSFLKSYFIQKDSFPDPTFGGILPSMTLTELQERLKNHIRERYPSGWVLYDDFSGTNIDKDKWKNWEFVREIRDGKLVSKITSYGSNLSNILNFINPASIYYIEADMSVNEIDGRFESLSNASLVGRFYNDGTGSPGSLVGEVMARIDLRYQWGQLTAQWSVSKSTDGSTWPWVANGSFPIPISLGQSYKLSILWEPAIKRLTFTVNGISQYWISTDNIYPSNGPWKGLSTSVWFSNPNLWGTVSATFDNVIAKDQSGNIVVSDDFSSPVIDKNKWSTYEMVSEISDGKLRSKVRSSSRSTGTAVFNDLNFIDPSSIQAIQVKVTPSVYQNFQGANLRARIAGRYYNDGTPGSGYTGDVGAQVTIGGTGVNPVGEWQVWRHTDSEGNYTELVASGTFTTPISLGNTYILFLSWDGSKFTFKLGNEEASYIPITSINPPHNPWRVIGTRILNPAGKESTIEAFFDDVMINSIVVSPQFVDFGAVELGSYFDQTVNVRNDGDDDVSINSVISPLSPFTIQSNNCLGQTLHSGESCNIVVRFSPTTEGQFNSKFNILTNYPTVPTQTVNLYGSGGVPPHEVLVPDTPVSGQVNNTSDTFWYKVQVTGSEPLFVHLDKTTGWDAGMAVYRGAINNPLKMSESWNDQMLMVEAPEEGAYYIAVWSVSPNRGLPGGYSLTVRRSLDSLTLGQKLENQQIAGDWKRKWYELKIDSSNVGKSLYLQQEKLTQGDTCLRLRFGTLPGDQPDSSTCGDETLTAGFASAQVGTYYIEVESRTFSALNYSMMAYTGEISPELPLCSTPLVILLKKGDLIWYKLNVPQAENLFVMVQKKEKAWTSSITIKNGSQTVAAVTESGDSILQLKNPQPGEYTLEINSLIGGEAVIRACTNLSVLNMDQLFVGTIYRNDGYDWLQMDIPAGSGALEFTVETIGNVSSLDVWRGGFDSSEHWFAQQYSIRL